MEIVKRVVKNNELSFFIGLFALFGFVEMGAMNVAPRTRLTPAQLTKQKARFIKQAPKKTKTNWFEQARQIEALEPDEWRVCEEETTNCIRVNRKVLELSNTIKNVLEDLGDNKVNIPMYRPIAEIKNAFDLLNISCERNGLRSVEEKIQTYSFDRLINTFNCIYYLNCPHMYDIFLRKIKKEMQKSNGKIISTAAFKQLNPDIQELLMIEPVIDCLKSKIINTQVDKRRILLDGPPIVNHYCLGFGFDSRRLIAQAGDGLISWDVSHTNKIISQVINTAKDPISLLVFSPDEKKIISQSFSEQGQLVLLWDVSNKEKITHQQIILPDNFARIRSVAFSPDGGSMVAGGYGESNNLILWDISNSDKITYQWLVGHDGDVMDVAFSSDGKGIVSGSRGKHNNLIVWDITDGEQIKHYVLTGHKEGVFLVAFSPDGRKVVSAGVRDNKSLILWNIEDIDNIKHTTLIESQLHVNAVAFSHDGGKIISALELKENNLLLFDISNYDSITWQSFVGHQGSVESAVFSPDDKRIVSLGGRMIGQSYEAIQSLVLWDMSDNNITHQALTIPSSNISYLIHTVRMSLDGNKIAATYKMQPNGYKAVLWTLLTDKEVASLNELKSSDLEQIRLLYQLCVAFRTQTKVKLTDNNKTVYNSLPKLFRDLLHDSVTSKYFKKISIEENNQALKRQRYYKRLHKSMKHIEYKE